MKSETLDTGALFRTYAPDVGRFLNGLGVKQQDCDDIVQDVFLIAHCHGVFEDRGAKPFTWLADIAFRLACAAGRKRRRRNEALDPCMFDELQTREPTAVEMIEAAEAHGRVHAALAAMSSDKRSILLRFEFGGHDCETIARDLGVPVGTVYSRLHHARGALAKLLDTPAPVPNEPTPASKSASCGPRRRRRKILGARPAGRESASAISPATARLNSSLRAMHP